DYTWDFERIGYEQTEKMLEAGALPGRTILCANDRLAFGVMAAAYSRGLKVGRRPDCDLRVAAHDDHPLSRYTCPALTTMAQDFAAMAGRSVEILLALLDEADPPKQDMARTVKLGATLVMRQSA
ncbi:MAG: LacI family transcriptional regulator, partial [Mesorhizobium sp.]